MVDQVSWDGWWQPVAFVTSLAYVAWREWVRQGKAG